jgi:hypothetical protein
MSGCASSSGGLTVLGKDALIGASYSEGYWKT